MNIDENTRIRAAGILKHLIKFDPDNPKAPTPKLAKYFDDEPYAPIAIGQHIIKRKGRELAITAFYDPHSKKYTMRTDETNMLGLGYGSHILNKKLSAVLDAHKPLTGKTDIMKCALALVRAWKLQIDDR